MRRRLFPILFGAAIVLLLASVRVADPFPVQALRDIAFDGYQRLSPRQSADLPVRIIDIDEESLAEIGQWPWPRDQLALLAQRLTELGAAAVVFDIMFAEPDRLSPRRLIDLLANDLRIGQIGLAEAADYDEVFAVALAASPSVLGFGVTPDPGPVPDAAKAGFAIVGGGVSDVPTILGTVSSIPVLLDAAQGLGSISLSPGGDVGTVRRLPLVWSNGSELFPSLSIEALRVAIGAQTIVVFSDSRGAGTIESVRVGDFEVPTTSTGELWLYYQPSSDALYLSAMQILGADWADQQNLIAGNIVLIGTSATGLLDIRGTALGDNMPGVEIHAQALQQILGGEFLRRPDLLPSLEIIGFIFLGLTMVITLRLIGPLPSLLIGGALTVGLGLSSWFAFTNAGLLIDPSFPLLGGLIVYSAMIFFQYFITDADKRKIRSAFGHYVAPSLLAEIEKSSASLKLGGETRELSVMFSDIRNFTTLSEGLTPPSLVTLLNTLFGALGGQITGQLGTIDKFIGDAIMAFWNAPVDVENHASRACAAALGMRQILASLNADDAFHLRERAHPIQRIDIGIGIATGEALVGNLGLETRFDYSCVGEMVNVASRVEGACKQVGYDIVVAEETHAAAKELAFLEAGEIALKGRSQLERVFILLGDAEFAVSSAFLRLKAAHAEAINALIRQQGAEDAIERCVSLIGFDDRSLGRFYQTMLERRSDFVSATEKSLTSDPETLSL